MNLNLNGKVALVTGANRGIGEGIARELAREGVDLYLVARDEKRLAQVAESISSEFGVSVRIASLDLRDAGSAARAVEGALNEWNRLDILVNNAGATKRGDFFSLTEVDWDDGFSLKFRATVRMTRAAWPYLKKQGGAVINIIGVGGWTAEAEFTIGGTVNAALMHFTKAVAQIGKQDGVRVNAINPGRIETERLSRNIARLSELNSVTSEEARMDLLRSLDIERFGTTGEIGQVAAFLASKQASYMQGALVDVDGGEHRSM